MASFLESLFGGGDTTDSGDASSTPSMGFGDRLQALGMAMASMKPGVGQMDVPRAMELQYNMSQKNQSQNALATVLMQSGMDPKLAHQLAANPDAAKMMYQIQLQKGMAGIQADADAKDPLLGGGGGAAGGAPAQARPAAPVPPPSIPSSGYMPPPGLMPITGGAPGGAPPGGAPGGVKMPSPQTPVLTPPPDTSFDNTPVKNVATAPTLPMAQAQQAPQEQPQQNLTDAQRAQALNGFRKQLQILTYAANNGLTGDAEAAKQRLEIYKKYISPTDQIATMRQAGIDPNSDLGRGMVIGTAKEGTVVGPNGQMSNAPGYIDALREKKAAEFGERYSQKAQYTPQEVQPTMGGPTRIITQAQALGMNPGPVGQGRFAPPTQAPGPGLQAPQAPGPQGAVAPEQAPGQQAAAPDQGQGTIVKQPKVFEQRQEQVAKEMDTMQQQYVARQVARQRLVEIGHILEAYKPGAFAEQKADFIAALRGVGLNVPDTATANPAKFEIFLKDATRNVFDDVKNMGGRVLVSEISGLTKSNANPHLQPEAARAIVGQGIGLIDFENARYQALHSAYVKNPYAYDLSQNNLDFYGKNSPADYVKKGQNNVPVLGEPIPRNPADRDVGKMYMHTDMNNKPVAGRWNGQQFIPRGAEQQLLGIASKYGTDSKTYQAAAKQFDATFGQPKGSAAASVIEMAQ